MCKVLITHLHLPKLLHYTRKVLHGVHQCLELLEAHLTALGSIKKLCAPALAPLDIIHYDCEPLEQLVVWKFTFCRFVLQCHQIFYILKGGKRN